MNLSTPCTLRTEEDLVAAVPVTLGFHPEESVVLIAHDPPPASPMFARIDLPAPGSPPGPVLGAILEPCLRGGFGRAALLVYAADPERAEGAAGWLAVRLRRGGVRVMVALRVHAGHWHGVAGFGPGEPVAFDLRDHRVTAQAVVDGQVVHSSRAGLEASVACTDRALARRVRRAHAAGRGWQAGTGTSATGSAVTASRAAERTWLVGTVERLVGSERAPDAATTARLLHALAVPDLRDRVCCSLDRATAAAHARLWGRVVRQTPDDLVAPAAAVLALTAWLSGDGALSWCAVERARQADPDHRLADLVGRLLLGAVPPSAWVPCPPEGPHGAGLCGQLGPSGGGVAEAVGGQDVSTADNLPGGP